LQFAQQSEIGGRARRQVHHRATEIASNQEALSSAGNPRQYPRRDRIEERMKVELVPPDPTQRRVIGYGMNQAFAMMLGPGSIEWGSKRSALEKFAYRAGDLALCDRHQGEWVGLMKVPHLQFGISDAALMAASEEPNGEVELRPHRKFADSRLGTLATIVHAEMVAGFPSGRLFLDSIEQAMAVALSVVRQ